MIDLRYGDCLEIMKTMPSKSVDLILTDPPYGKKADKGTNGFGSAKNRRYNMEDGTAKDHQKRFLMKCCVSARMS